MKLWVAEFSFEVSYKHECWIFFVRQMQWTDWRTFEISGCSASSKFFLLFALSFHPSSVSCFPLQHCIYTG